MRCITHGRILTILRTLKLLKLVRTQNRSLNRIQRIVTNTCGSSICSRFDFETFQAISADKAVDFAFVWERMNRQEVSAAVTFASAS